MVNFEYQNTTRLIFGSNIYEEVGRSIRLYSNNVLIVYGSERIRENGLLGAVEEVLKKENISFEEMGGVVQNPRLSLIDNGIRLCKEKGIDFILAIGGGSVIDTAKTISVGACYNGNVWDFFKNNVTVKRALEVGVIVTTPFTQSSTTNEAVIINEDTCEKRRIVSELIRPVFNIIDPEFFKTLSTTVAMKGTCSLFGHLLENYLLQEDTSRITDVIMEEMLINLMNSMKILKSDVSNSVAWSEVALVNTILYSSVLSVLDKTEKTFSLLANSLAGKYDISDGESFAMLMPASIVHLHGENLDNYKKLLERVFGISSDGLTNEQVYEKCSNKLSEFFSEIGMKNSLSQFGINDVDSTELANLLLNRYGLRDDVKSLSVDSIAKVYETIK